MSGNGIIDLFLEMYNSFVLCKQGSFGQTCLKLLFQIRLFIFDFDHILIWLVIESKRIRHACDVISFDCKQQE